MAKESLEDAVQAADGITDLLVGGAPFPWPGQPDEYSNWREEQRAWRESCSLRNHTPVNPVCRFEGPEALDLLSRFGVNDFSEFDAGQAKQYVACNPGGHLIGDMILFCFGEDSYGLTGVTEVANWLRYQAEAGGYDVTTNFDNSYELVADQDRRDFFRYSIQGPNAATVMEKVVDGSIPDIPFFQFDDVTIDGTEVSLFHHGMAGETGYEFWGPHDERESVWDSVVATGKSYGLRRLGNRAYQVMSRESGWMPGPLPAVFGEETKGYREWVDSEDFINVWSLTGSFDADDITEYYLDPVEVGYGHLIDFDHEFMGQSALRDHVENQERTKVTLVWDDGDLVDVWRGSLHREGETYKYMDYPVLAGSIANYDAVSKNGEVVGVSKRVGYSYNERKVLSLAVIDLEYSDPGTEVTLRWGEAREASSPAIEPHVQAELEAIVATVPYVEDRHGRGA